MLAHKTVVNDDKRNDDDEGASFFDYFSLSFMIFLELSSGIVEKKFGFALRKNTIVVRDTLSHYLRFSTEKEKMSEKEGKEKTKRKERGRVDVSHYHSFPH